MINLKMKKFSFRDVNTVTGHTGGKQSDQLISFTARLDKESSKSMVMDISFHERLASQAGFVVGDYVSFDYDDGIMYLKKDNAGRKIGLPGGRGNCKRPRVRFSIPREYLGLFMQKRPVEVESEAGAVCFKLV